MANIIYDCITYPSDFGIPSGKSRPERLAHLLFHRPDIHWLSGKPDPQVKSPDNASPSAVVYSEEEIGLRAPDGGVDFIGLDDGTDDMEYMNDLNDGISDIAEQLFSGIELREHMHFSPGTLFGKIPRDISEEDLVFMMAFFRYVHRTLDRVIYPESVRPGTKFDMDEFETVMLFFLGQKLRQANKSLDAIADELVSAWV